MQVFFLLTIFFFIFSLFLKLIFLRTRRIRDIWTQFYQDKASEKSGNFFNLSPERKAKGGECQRFFF